MTSSCPVALSPHFWFYYYFLIVCTCNRGFRLFAPLSPLLFFFYSFFRIESPTFTPMPIAHWWWELGNIATTRSCFHSHSLTLSPSLSLSTVVRQASLFFFCELWMCSQ